MGSNLCTDIVKLYRTYSLYYIALHVSSNCCEVYLYYFSSPTQILRALVAPMQLVPATASHHPLPLKSQWWRSHYGVNGDAPITAPAIVGPSILPPPHQCPIQSIFSIQPVANQPAHKIQFLLANPRPIPIRSSQYYPANKIHPIRSIWYNQADKIHPDYPLKGKPQQHQA